VTDPQTTLPSATRPLRPELVSLLRGLKAGQRIRIVQKMRVGSSAKWDALVEGIFRNVNFLATGIATERVPEEDIVVVTVHFKKDNGELSSISIDEHTRIAVL
jgi:hypothetical protein